MATTSATSRTTVCAGYIKTSSTTSTDCNKPRET